MNGVFSMRMGVGLLVALFFFAPARQLVAEEFPLTVRVVDQDSRAPLPSRLYLHQGDKWFYFAPAESSGTAVRYEKQNWNNKNSIEYHTTVSAHPVTTNLPPGSYELTVAHGKSYFPVTRQVVVSDKKLDLTIPLKRWNDPAARGWYSGDTHLHRTIDELKTIVQSEDLNVALPLTYWVTIGGQPPSAGNKNQADIPKEKVQVDAEHVIWPRSTEYEIFQVAGKRHTLGALFVLGHRDALSPSVPPWKPVVDSVRESDPNALFDMDKLDWPFAMLLPTLAPDALYELANNHVWRTPFAFRSWNTRAPGFMRPPFGESEGGHREWIDYTHGMYHTLLNCGFKMPPSAGTANGVHPVPAGFGRVYVHLEDGFDLDEWMKGLKAGRSFVTTGPMLYATADDKDPGHQFRVAPNHTLKIEAEIQSEKRLSYGELIVNGKPVTLLRPNNQRTAEGAFQSKITADVTVERSGWFALRFWEPREDGQSRFVHSAPWYVDVHGKPQAIAAEEKQYLIDRMEEELVRSEGIVPEPGLAEYRQALEFYRSLRVVDDSAELSANARPLPDGTRKRWLDNMIIDHRYTAHEVRAATGMSLAAARDEIAIRDGRVPEPGVRIRPYPGGRHPRIGFLDGALMPMRETKVSLFPPWSDGGYAVVDVPEAIFSNLGLTYLAHTHIPTIWDDQQVTMEPLEWRSEGDSLQHSRELPNGIRFTSSVSPTDGGALMQIELENGTRERLTGMRVQICTMLKGAVGFNLQESPMKVSKDSFQAVRSFGPDRWIITSWTPNHRVWTNPPVPCMHSDPIFPDCEPGEKVSVTGGLWFYEGNDIEAELERLGSQP